MAKKNQKKKSGRVCKMIKKVVRKKVKKIIKAKARQAKNRVHAMGLRKAMGIRKQPTAVKPNPIVKLVAEPVSNLLKEGDLAPDFMVPTDQGHTAALSDFRGKKVVLYFYPKDDTPGCTREACAFRDGIAKIQAQGAVVLGVSADSVESHQKFRDKYNLNFPLLSDENRSIVQDYGVWKEKSMYGRTYMGIERTTFLIDETGRIQRIFPKVSVEIHYDEVLQALAA